MMFLKQILRVTRLCIAVISYLFRAMIIHLTTTDSHQRRRKFAQNVSRSCAQGLKALNVEVKTSNNPSNCKRYLIVANHLGYLDIFAIASTVPCLFVTSVEMKETPFLGLLTEMAGCMYVERRNRANIHNEIKEIEAALNDGFNVVVYPEGRSTNGEMVHPFKKSLLMACAGSEANILPAVVNFDSINGEPMQHKFRDWVCWYGDMPFVSSVFQAAQMNQCLLKLDFLDEIIVNGSSNHKDIAASAQSQIEAQYIKIPLPPQNDLTSEKTPLSQGGLNV
jgi:1-acyl-sn-glycerol-3-phosphate acyltransferase